MTCFAPDHPRPSPPRLSVAEYPIPNADGLNATLLVEDNPADVWLIHESLAHHGLRPLLYVANDGEEAIRLIDQIDSKILACPDFVILDINLPKKSGLEVLARIRSSPQCSRVMVAVVSSSEAARDREEAARLGASAYLGKPGNLEQFVGFGNKLKELFSR